MKKQQRFIPKQRYGLMQMISQNVTNPNLSQHFDSISHCACELKMAKKTFSDYAKTHKIYKHIWKFHFVTQPQSNLLLEKQGVIDKFIQNQKLLKILLKNNINFFHLSEVTQIKIGL